MQQTRKQTESHRMSLLAGSCSIALAFGLTQAAIAQGVPVSAVAIRPAATQIAAAATPATDAVKPFTEEQGKAATPRKARGEGVRVHGHWLLEVKNADGTLADRREFENSLITSGGANYGSQLLVGILSGNITVGPPYLALVETPQTDTSTVCLSVSTGNCWYVVPSGSELSGLNVQTGLTALVNFTPVTNLIISGTFQAPASGSITFAAVESLFFTCVPNGMPYFNSNLLSKGALFSNANVAPNNCTTTSSALNGGNIFLPAAFTYTTITQNGLNEPLTVAPSQTVSIVFTLSFS